MKDNDTAFNFTMPKSMHKWLKKEAEKEGISMAEYIKRILRVLNKLDFCFVQDKKAVNNNISFNPDNRCWRIDHDRIKGGVVDTSLLRAINSLYNVTKVTVEQEKRQKGVKKTSEKKS